MKIIVLSGKARSGKNLVASMLEEEIKNKNLKSISISYASYLKIYTEQILNIKITDENKPRTFLQELGDLVKEIDKKFLINRLLEDIEVYKNYFDTIIVTDARFKEEIECIKEKYEDVVVINIKGKENDLTLKEKNHITETALDNYNLYDYIIDNNETVNDLKNKIIEVMEDIVW